MRLFLDILNFIIFFSILISPYYYEESSFLRTFLPYLATFIWFTLVLAIGFKVALSYFLIVLYLALLFIYFSDGIEFNTLIGLFLGIVASVLLFFSRGMNLKNE